MLNHIIRILLVFVTICAQAWGAVNINTANVSELQTLPGIGPSKAEAIAKYRSENGAFTSIEQLDAVPGIGPATMANLRPLVVLQEGDSPQTPTAVAPPAPKVGSMVNINNAPESVLTSLPGIGPSKAKAIIQDRETKGPFASCDDLQRVHGVGPATVVGLKSQCTVE